MSKVCDMPGVREYAEGLPVELHTDGETGRLVIRAYNEAGFSGTEIDLADLLSWIEARPEFKAAAYAVSDRPKRTEADAADEPKRATAPKAEPILTDPGYVTCPKCRGSRFVFAIVRPSNGFTPALSDQFPCDLCHMSGEADAEAAREYEAEKAAAADL